MDNIDLSEREEALRVREEAIAAREQELAIEAERQRPNWPFFYPVVRHDILSDIPEEHQDTVHKIYRYWLATVGLLFVNTLIFMIVLIDRPANLPLVGSDFGVSLFYIFFIGAASFFSWYRPVYLALAHNSALYTLLFLVFHGCHIVFAFYMAIGIPGSGGGGFITTLALFAGGKLLVGLLLGILCMGGWIVDGLYGLYLWKLIYNYNRNSGHTLESARNEAVSMGVKSGVVTGVATEAARQSYLRSETGTFV